jgi:hypothetical protein
MLAVMVPVAYVGMQDTVNGWLVMLTVYAAPLAYVFENVWVLLLLKVSVAP